jgi:hypothetical protein
MHTSTRLQATDFSYWRVQAGTSVAHTFADFCPDYHALDRVGVVSPCLEDGVLAVGAAVLALTTAFYDWLRERTTDFFDYPQHFALVGATQDGLCTRGGLLPLETPKLWDGWSWLDVWPAPKWAPAPATANGFLERVFALQINRLFWPAGLQPAPDEAPLPDYAYRMLRTHLKVVYTYETRVSADACMADEALEIRLAPAAIALLEESMAKLPPQRTGEPATHRVVSCYRPVAVADFLTMLTQPHPAKPTTEYPILNT